MDIKDLLIKELASTTGTYSCCGIIDKRGTIYPIGSDTKVLSTVFELVCRPLIYRVATAFGKDVAEPLVQNHYPDFTLLNGPEDRQKIAIDIKTTYRDKPTDKFSYTLGGYTSFIRPGNERKNIMFPFTDYARHLVIGFVYDRPLKQTTKELHEYNVKDLDKVPIPFENVEFFVQDKWKIAGDKAGSGNTTNIGSFNGTLADFSEGKAVFNSEEEFLDYWRGYGKTAGDRQGIYGRIAEYRALKGKS